MVGFMTHGGWMILVSDASVAVKWAVEEGDSKKAIRLLNGEHELHVPRMLAAELANALRSKVLSGVLGSSSGCRDVGGSADRSVALG